MSTEFIIAISSSPLFAAFFAWLGSRREKKASAKRSELKTAMDEISVYNKIIEDLKKERGESSKEIQSLRELTQEVLKQNTELLKKVGQLKKDYYQLEKSYSSLQKSYEALDEKYQEMLNQINSGHEQN